MRMIRIDDSEASISITVPSLEQSSITLKVLNLRMPMALSSSKALIFWTSEISIPQTCSASSNLKVSEHRSYPIFAPMPFTQALYVLFLVQKFTISHHRSINQQAISHERTQSDQGSLFQCIYSSHSDSRVQKSGRRDCP